MEKILSKSFLIDKYAAKSTIRIIVVIIWINFIYFIIDLIQKEEHRIKNPIAKKITNRM